MGIEPSTLIVTGFPSCGTYGYLRLVNATTSPSVYQESTEDCSVAPIKSGVPGRICTHVCRVRSAEPYLIEPREHPITQQDSSLCSVSSPEATPVQVILFRRT